MRTGFILATPGAAVAKVPLAAAATEVPLDLSLEEKLVALEPLPARQADVTFRMALTGNMAKYVWTLDNLAWPNHPPLMVSQGQRVVLEMTNQTMMAHPMHLHGHHFQVIALDDKPLERHAPRHDPRPAAAQGHGRLRRRQSRRLAAPLPQPLPHGNRHAHRSRL